MSHDGDRHWQESLRLDVEELLPPQISFDDLDATAFAGSIMAAYPLLHSLFCNAPLDAMLKLLVLHELSRSTGRFDLERIRGLVPFLPEERVEALTRSLRDGGWFEMRQRDLSYVISPLGMNLLSLLHGASFDRLSPANLLARAAQNAEFAATLDGGGDDRGYLLASLQNLLETQVEEASHILRFARPWRMIAWSRRDHRRQIEIIRKVVEALFQHLDEDSRAFLRVVSIHRLMQEIIRQHNGISMRLREWNLERLHHTEGGYSIPELSEAILGVEDEATWTALLDAGILRAGPHPPSTSAEELRDRFVGARRRLRPEEARFVYEAPPPAEDAGWDLVWTGEADALRHRLHDALRHREPGTGPIELDAWFEAGDFASLCRQLDELCSLEASGLLFPEAHAPGGANEANGADGDAGTRGRRDGARIPRRARLRVPALPPLDAEPGRWLARALAEGCMRPLHGGWVSRILVDVMDPDPADEAGRRNGKEPRRG